jgi:hypothetical protein
MIKINFLPAFTLIACSIVLLFFKQYEWRRDTEMCIRRLLHNEQNGKKITSNDPTSKAVYHDNHAQAIQETLHSLPLAIQRYLKNVLNIIVDEDRGTSYMVHEPIRIIKSVKIDQEGSIFLNDKWVPFKATQVSSCIPSSPGFVWDSETSMFPKIPLLNNLKIRARDSYVNGKGNLNVSVAGVLPLVKASGKEADIAEFMRWMAEMSFYPTSYLPHDGTRLQWVKDVKGIKGPWPDHHGSFARAKLVDPLNDIEGELEFLFDENNLLTTIRGYRLMTSNGKSEYLPWEGYITEYDFYDGIMVPSSATIGYYIDGKFSPYFKGKYKNFVFDFF